MPSSRTANRTDYLLLLLIVMLVVFGLLMVYSATFTFPGDSLYYLKRQIIWATLGFCSMAVLSRMDYQLWRHLALPFLGVVLLLLVAVLLVGRGGTAQSWFLGGSVQPSELAKLAFVIYIAAWLASKGEKIRDVTYGLIPFAILLGIVTGLVVKQPDLGTAMLIVLTAGTMFFIAGADLGQIATALIIGCVVLGLVVMQLGYAQQRIRTFLHPEEDKQGAGYQIDSVLTALRSGGIVGRGLGEGLQKQQPPYLHHTDTIFSVIGEELGLIGCLATIALFLFVAYRGLLISLRAPDTFGSLLALGMSCWFVVQAMVHIGVNSGVIPFTGITLPFISYGGSSLTVSLAAVGVVLSVSRVAHERKTRTSATFAFRRRDRRPRLSRTRRTGRTR